jgi:hypothetical protein
MNLGFCFFPADMGFIAYRYRVLVVYAATILVRGRVNAQDVSGDGSDDAGKLAVHLGGFVSQSVCEVDERL